MCSEPRNATAPIGARATSTPRPAIVVAPTTTATPTAASTATPTVTATHTATPKPPGPPVTGSGFFKQRVQAGAEWLRFDPTAYRRYTTAVEGVQQAPSGTLADGLLTGAAAGRLVRVPVEALAITLDPFESLRQTAAILSRESTHVAYLRGDRSSLALAFDGAYLNDATLNYWSALRSREQQRIADETERRRLAQLPGCDGRTTTESARCRDDLERALQDTQRQANEALEARLQQEASVDPAAAYLQLLRSRPLSPAQQVERLTSACWAKHNELFTYLRLNGRSLDVLQAVLMVNTPTCRTALGIR